MELLWHSLLNVLVVLGACVLALIVISKQELLKHSFMFLFVGSSFYGLSIYMGLKKGRCHTADGFIDNLVAIEACIDTYSFEALTAQASILALCLIGLYLAWRPILRKLTNWAEQQNNKTDI